MNIYDLIIVGGGPAGAAAGVYAARKKLKTLLIAESFGGQSVDSGGIENWIGTLKISGEELAKKLREHVEAYAGDSVEILEGSRANKINKVDGGFEVEVADKSFRAKTVLIATGGSRRKLDVPGAKEYEARGIAYCASCDAPLFQDKDVVVVGGGNAGFESAAQLLVYANSVTLLARSSFRADEVTVENVLKHPKMKAVKNAVPIEVKGEKFVKSIVYEVRNENSEPEKIELPVQGIFVEIGHMPATGLVSHLAELDEIKKIKVDHRTQKTSVHGLWAAGDCTDTLYHQNNIAAGDAVKALEDIYIELQKMR